MLLFTELNTSGYTSEQLDDMNADWEEYVVENGLEEYTDEYYEEADIFADAVAKRDASLNELASSYLEASGWVNDLQSGKFDTEVTS